VVIDGFFLYRFSFKINNAHLASELYILIRKIGSQKIISPVGGRNPSCLSQGGQVKPLIIFLIDHIVVKGHKTGSFYIRRVMVKND
jgi:hypothetical protein